MDIKDIEATILKLQKVGFACCESCKRQSPFSEIENFNGSYLCPDCLKKVIWKPEDVIELPL